VGGLCGQVVFQEQAGALADLCVKKKKKKW